MENEQPVDDKRRIPALKNPATESIPVFKDSNFTEDADFWAHCCDDIRTPVMQTRSHFFKFALLSRYHQYSLLASIILVHPSIRFHNLLLWVHILLNCDDSAWVRPDTLTVSSSSASSCSFGEELCASLLIPNKSSMELFVLQKPRTLPYFHF